MAQRYFNESEFVKKIKEISKSIGKPKANVSRTRPGAPEAAITVFWDIVWYQYLVDLRKELPADTERVMLAQEGMDLQELRATLHREERHHQRRRASRRLGARGASAQRP